MYSASVNSCMIEAAHSFRNINYYGHVPHCGFDANGQLATEPGHAHSEHEKQPGVEGISVTHQRLISPLKEFAP
jgi:hypothetical protein